MKRYRIRQLDSASTPIWVIDEIVTPQGKYITWPERFAKSENARDFLAKEIKRSRPIMAGK